MEEVGLNGVYDMMSRKSCRLIGLGTCDDEPNGWRGVL